MAVQCIHLGVGGRGKWPVAMFAERDDVESAAFVDVHEGNMNAAMEVSGLPESRCFRTLEQALNNVESDCVIVITPPDSHADMILEAVRAGKHVLVEKPFTKTLASAKHVVEEADRMGVKVGVSQKCKIQCSDDDTIASLARRDVWQGEFWAFYQDWLAQQGGTPFGSRRSFLFVGTRDSRFGYYAVYYGRVARADVGA